MSDNPREFDVVVWGATGFTGRLVAEHLFERHGAGRDLRWAMGGRDPQKLVQVRTGLGPDAASIPIVTGDSLDAGSLNALVPRATVICSTVGPYSKFGSELVAACARHGTHYCDITGEPQWIRRMIDQHEARARESGARIVHCCGFDSIPSDLGVLMMNRAMQERAGGPCEAAKARVIAMRGAFSGGTVASLLNVLDEGKKDRNVRRLLVHPYALNPVGEQSGPDGRDQTGATWDPDLRAWTGPFVMASINTKVVRRSNALLAYAYGRNFRYSEAVATGRGLRGRLTAWGLSAGLGLFMAAASAGPTRRLLEARFLPAPGEGPGRQQREAGFFKMRLIGRRGDVILRGEVAGDRDPGYGSTSRMLAESAVCLAQDATLLRQGGGSWTPASMMGSRLEERLQKNAGISFHVEDGLP